MSRRSPIHEFGRVVVYPRNGRWHVWREAEHCGSFATESEALRVAHAIQEELRAQAREDNADSDRPLTFWEQVTQEKNLDRIR